MVSMQRRKTDAQFLDDALVSAMNGIVSGTNKDELDPAVVAIQAQKIVSNLMEYRAHFVVSDKPVVQDVIESMKNLVKAVEAFDAPNISYSAVQRANLNLKASLEVSKVLLAEFGEQ